MLNSEAVMKLCIAGGMFVIFCFPIPVSCSAEAASQGSPLQAVADSEFNETATPGVDTAVQVAQQEIRDPFDAPPAEGAPVSTAPATGAPALPDIKVELQGVGYGNRDAYAIINGEVLYEGDDKNGIKLLEVRRGEVDILMGGGKVTVPLFPGDELQKSKERAQKKSAETLSSTEQSLKEQNSSPQKEQALS